MLQELGPQTRAAWTTVLCWYRDGQVDSVSGGEPQVVQSEGKGTDRDGYKEGL